MVKTLRKFYGLANDANQNQYADGVLYWDDGETWVDDFSTHNYYYFQFSFYAEPHYGQLNITMAKKAVRKITRLDLGSLEFF